MGRTIGIKIIFALILFSALFFARGVLATGWWGDGVKSDEWILNHGGALIRFEIYNRQGESNEYKALLTRSGKKIEVELGKKGLFDEARNNKYKVTFYRGGDGLKSFDNLGSHIASKSFDVHKGESIKLKLDYKKKKISFETDYIKSEEKAEEEIEIADVQPKKTPVLVKLPEPKLAPEPEPEPEKEEIENPCFNGLFRPVICQSSLFPLDVVFFEPAIALNAPSENEPEKIPAYQPSGLNEKINEFIKHFPLKILAKTNG